MGTTCEQLALKMLTRGTKFHVETQSWDDARLSMTYELTVIEEGEEPLCDIYETSEEGMSVHYQPLIVEGAGFVTTSIENPTQTGDPLFGRPHQDRATTIRRGQLIVGGTFIVRQPETHPVKRAELGRKCTGITVYQAE